MVYIKRVMYYDMYKKGCYVLWYAWYVVCTCEIVSQVVPHSRGVGHPRPPDPPVRVLVVAIVSRGLHVSVESYLVSKD
jgi:hypothetical protein